MTAPLQAITDAPGASVVLAQKAERTYKKRPAFHNDRFGRTGRVQVLHIDLWYADGTKGEINVTAPQIAWGHDIELQWNALRGYIVKEHKALGIIRYHAHCASIKDGVIRTAWSWFPFDLILNQEVR